MCLLLLNGSPVAERLNSSSDCINRNSVMKKSKAFSKRTFGWDLFVTSQVNFGPELLSTSKAVPFESKVSAGLNIRFFEIPIYNKGPI